MTDPATPNPVIGFAHRGARAHAPENTIEAFLTACHMGARALETDVWLTGDGVAVIDHDGVVKKFGTKVPIDAVAVSDLPPHLPTLAALQYAVGPIVDLSIDVKDPAAAPAIVSIRSNGGRPALQRTWLCDTDPTRLAGWRDLDGDVHLVASLRRHRLGRWNPERLASMGIEVLNLPHRHWTPALIRRCHAVGLGAFAWGVQRPRRMRRLVAWGIDAIYSDHTDRMVETLRATTNQSDRAARSGQTRDPRSKLP